MYFVVSHTSCTVEGVPNTISSCIRGKVSQGSRPVGVGGCSRGARDRERVGTNSLGSDQVMGGRSLGGLVRELKIALADVWEGGLRTFWGLGILAGTTRNTSAPIGRCRSRNSYVHPELLLPSTHGVQGCLASHFWRSGVSPRVPRIRFEIYHHPPSSSA